MKNNMFLIGLFVIMLFVFGCSQQQPGGSPPSTTPTPSSTPPAAQPSPSPQPSPAPTPAPVPTPQPIGPDFSNKGYEELVALGMPVECDVKIAKDQQTMKLYVKGKTFRTETSSPETPECKKSVSIFKDLDAIYVGCEGQEIIPQCKWLKIGLDPSTVQPTSSSSAVSSSDLEKVPKPDFSCKAGTFTDAIFTPSGKICDLTELTKGLDTGGLDYTDLPSDAGSVDGAPPIPE